MSRAYPSIVAETVAEVDRWAENQQQRVKAWPSASIDGDTGLTKCRLMPVFPTKKVGVMWWPMPMEIVDLDAAKSYLSENGLQYDKSRHSKVGYERGMVINLS